MGNVSSRIDAEAAAVAALAEAAAAGARQAVADEFLRARVGAAGSGSRSGSGAGGGAGAGAGEEVVHGGVVTVVEAQNAAAVGAIRAVESVRGFLTSPPRFDHRLSSDLTGSSACGSAAGLSAVAEMDRRSRAANPDVENPDVEGHLEFILSAAATGARAAALFAGARLAATAGGSSHSRYASLVSPFLSGALPAGCALYLLVMHSPVWIQRLVFGCASIGFFAASTGSITGFLGTSSQTYQYSRCAAMFTFLIIWFLLAFGMTTTFQSTKGRAFCGSIGGVLIGVFFFCWLYHGW